MTQNTLKALALGAVLGFTFSIVPSCGTPTPTTCGSANCSTGCCNNGKCVTGTNTNNTTCGTAGNSCSDCTKTSGSSCDKSTFKCTGGSTGGGTGGSGGGSTGGGTGGTGGGATGGGTGGGMASCQATCAGCCDATGVCKTSGNTTCGVNGATCAACASPATCNAGTCKDTTCATCSKNGVCQTAAMLGNTTCGNGGITCIDCTTTAGATCNTTTGMCTGGTCAGCRDATSACVAGNTKGACGLGGGTCSACTGTQVCSNGACVAGTGGGAGGGGGGGTGGTGGTGTCPGGAPCTNGCCSGTQCIATTFQSQTNCGFNGATCSPCASNQTCNTGVCTGGAGGGAGGAGGTGGTGGTGGSATGALGAACNLDTDCGGVAITTQEAAAGFKAFCKKNLNPENSPYSGGYCTRRCIPGSAPCPAGGFCDYIDAPYGEFDNICLAPCTGQGQGTCRAGYGCFPYGASTNFCYPLYADGGSDSFPPGPGNVGNPAAGACTTSAMCAPTVAVYPSTFPAGFCAPQTLPDGGNSGFPQGMCRTECGAALAIPAASGGADAWCGTNGACNGYILGNSNTGPVIGWLCDQECTHADAGVRSTCRTGYACDAPANGKCIPRCDQPGNSCAAPTPNCNTTTGLCGP